MTSLERTLARSGAMGALVRAFPWSETPLGPMETWPAGACFAVQTALSGGLPLSVVLGQRPSTALVLYNDAFAACLGHKHPWALGRSAREVWPEIWDFFEWALSQVWRTGQPVTGKDLLLRVERGLDLEEIYATLSFSPISDDAGAPCGALVCCIETTAAVLSARREHTLRLIAESLREARTEDDLHRGVAAALSAAKDATFALLYVLDLAGERALLRAVVGIRADGAWSPREVDLRAEIAGPWPLRRVVSTRETMVVGCAGVTPLSIGALASPPRSAAVVPVRGSARDHPLGVLVVGLHPALAFDASYEGFVRLVAHQIAGSLHCVRSLQDARRRADALAELDRAKTTFLTNVSHEFRTPLTLVIGPLEDLLGDPLSPLSPAQAAALEGVCRNAYRVLRHVNTLLDFARADAGAAAVDFEPTDLAGLTRETALAFEPTVERAGLGFHVDCPPAPAPVVVAREMWEQIVLNLLSNALKFTFAGEISVSLRCGEQRAWLTVRDTGTGIPAEALPHLFERFYRVPGATARTHEGIGIGLALVHELVKLHDGSIQVSSTPGEGTTFTVDVPRYPVHLPADRRRSESAADVRYAVAPFIEDARGWLAAPAAAATATGAPPAAEDAPPSAPAGRILIAEDSDEMRDYLARMLGSTYEIEAVSNGTAALASARARPPAVVLSDVVMPGLDGLSLLRALRDDPQTREVPVVLLSSRGGEDVLVDAFGRGADDYLVKPFSARELRARVRTHMELARARRDAGESRLKDVFLGLASHELRTPLTCLKLNVQLAYRELCAVDERLAGRLAGLHRSIDRMTRLVNDMLSISSISVGKLALRPAPCDLADICRAAAAEQAQATRREPSLSLPSEAVPVLADEDRLGEVVGNLLSNALKYSAAARPVELGLHAEGSEAIVTVRDEGPGIPAADLAHLFERFYRAPGIGVRSGSYVGLGLGLFLSKAIVEQHGGRIWVESVVGQGSTFSFAVPLAGSAGALPGSSPAAPS